MISLFKKYLFDRINLKLVYLLLTCTSVLTLLIVRLFFLVVHPDVSTFMLLRWLFDSPEAWQVGFQDSASQGLTGITDLHNSIFFFLILILLGVFWALFAIICAFNSKKTGFVNKYWNHGTAIELIWTVAPAFILLIIAQPSFALLYILDEVISPILTVKVVGNQWFWSFEYSDYENESGESISFESYMIPENDLEFGQFRLLEVDNKVKIPVDTHARFIVTAADVIHDYAVPSLGLKVDAVPGRLNQASTLAERTGTFYGQCSEICGVYHGFMPTAVEAVSLLEYLEWIDSSSLFIMGYNK